MMSLISKKTLLLMLFLMGSLLSGCAGTSGSTVASGTKVGSNIYDSLREGASNYDEVVSRLGAPASKHVGITIDYRYQEVSEMGKGFDAIYGGVGQKKLTTECVTLVFDAETKKLINKRRSECDAGSISLLK